ncbi:MAG TPA: glucokinase, partial [Methylibium sp.]
NYSCADHASLADAMQRYLDEHGGRPRWGAIGLANPVTGDQVRMTNSHWVFSISETQRRLGLTRFVVINDLTALALALPALSPAELKPIGGGQAVAGAPLGVVGPGTGLGVAGLLPATAGRGAIPISSEGGHATLAPEDAQEEAVIRVLRERYGHASAERALSGAGLVNLYQAVCVVQGVRGREIQAADVTTLALSGEDAQCVAALDLFCALLGSVAGNVALMLCARGGIYIGGGIVPRLGAAFERSRFRERFEAKGQLHDYVREIPTYVIQAQVSPALLGAARALEEL